MYYNKIFITQIPSFYKTNLYNRINEKIKILVIYTNDTGGIPRSKDFLSGCINFDHFFLKKKSDIGKAFEITTILKKISYKEVIFGGWYPYSMCISAFFFSKKKCSVAIESSYHESHSTGLRGIIKKMFIKRMSKVYASGMAQKKLAQSLTFKGKIIITHGVGIFNYIHQPPYIEKKEVKNFIYVGRLSMEKNLICLISTFNRHPEYILNIIGSGTQEISLKKISQKNIKFHGEIDNKLLQSFYQSNDVFILPSLSEPWGLVVEEALNNGLPVIVSNKVGCAEEIVNENNGIIFNIQENGSLIKAILKMTNIDYYNNLRKNISKLDFEKTEMNQVKCYIE